MEKKCLLAAMLFYAGLCVCANTEDFKIASRELAMQEAIREQMLQDEMVAAVRQLLPVHGPERILTDAQIRTALAEAQRTIRPAHIPAQRLQSVENDMRLDLAQHYPGRAFNDQEIRKIALRGLQTQEAVRLLTPEDHN